MKIPCPNCKIFFYIRPCDFKKRKYTCCSMNCRKKFYKPPEQEKAWNWKGSNVSKTALHQWGRKYVPKPKFCQKCNKVKPYDLANKSNEYKRVLDDWEWLCRRCHMLSDGRIQKLKEMGEKRRLKDKICPWCKCSFSPYSLQTIACSASCRQLIKYHTNIYQTTNNTTPSLIVA